MMRLASLIALLAIFALGVSAVARGIPQVLLIPGTEFKFEGAGAGTVVCNGTTYIVTQKKWVVYQVLSSNKSSVVFTRSYCITTYVNGALYQNASKCVHGEVIKVNLDEYTEYWIPVKPSVGASFQAKYEVVVPSIFSVKALGLESAVAYSSGVFLVNASLGRILCRVSVPANITQSIGYRLSDGFRVNYTYSLVASGANYSERFDYAELLSYLKPSKYAVTVTVSGLPSSVSTTLIVDGIPVQNVSSATIQLYFDYGTSHTIALLSPVVAGDVKYECSQCKASVSGPSTLTFSFEVKYRVVLRGQTVRGEGVFYREDWFKPGSYQLSVPSEIAVKADTKLVFKRWEDGSTSNPRLIYINAPTSLTAVYAYSYYVQVNSAPFQVPVSGGGWVEEGKTIRVVAAPVYYLGRGVRLVFIGWSGDFAGGSPNITLTVYSPMVLTANYKRQFLVRVETSPPSVGAPEERWVDEGAKLTLTADKIVNVNSTVRYIFVGWSNGASDTTITLTVSEPLTLRKIYKPQFYVQVYSPYGHPLGGGWYTEGEEALITVESKVSSVIVDYVFQGWYDENGNVISSNPTVSFKVTSPRKLVARWRVDYSPLLTYASILALTGAAVVLFSRGYVSQETLTALASRSLAFFKKLWSSFSIAVEGAQSLLSSRYGVQRPSRAPERTIGVADLDARLAEYDSILAEIERYKSYLEKLESKKSEISELAYSELKREYSERLAQLNERVSAVRQYLVESGAWTCKACGTLNSPQQLRCRRCGSPRD